MVTNELASIGKGETAPISNWLLDLLACPTCHQPLEAASEKKLRCSGCAKDFSLTPKGQPDLRLSAPALLSPPKRGVTRRFPLIRRVQRGVTRRLQVRLYGLGNKVECCYCGWRGARFLPAGDSRRGNRLCPGCGSLERYRALYLYLREHSRIFTAPTRVLDVATKSCFRQFCQSLSNVKYVSSDLMTEGAMVFSDLTQMGMASESFDIITCMHVMEHVPDDMAAFAELRRLLKPDGFAVVVVPLAGGKTFEDPNARPEDYERLYGQYDHVRIYGMDVVERMKEAGLQVTRIDLHKTFPPETFRRYALRGDDRYFFRLSRAN